MARTALRYSAVLTAMPGLTMNVISLVFVFTLLPGGCTEGRREPLPCLERAVFGHPWESPYILSYPASHSYRLAQENCYPCGGHRDQLA